MSKMNMSEKTFSNPLDPVVILGREERVSIVKPAF